MGRDITASYRLLMSCLTLWSLGLCWLNFLLYIRLTVYSGRCQKAI